MANMLNFIPQRTEIINFIIFKGINLFILWRKHKNIDINQISEHDKKLENIQLTYIISYCQMILFPHNPVTHFFHSSGVGVEIWMERETDFASVDLTLHSWDSWLNSGIWQNNHERLSGYVAHSVKRYSTPISERGHLCLRLWRDCLCRRKIRNTMLRVSFQFQKVSIICILHF